MDERTTRLVLLVTAHVIFLSAFFLRLRVGARRHRLRSSGPWWVEYAPPLAWIPWGIAIIADLGEVEVASIVRVLGLAIAAGGALFAAWSMWWLGRRYAVRMDVFADHTLATDGPYAIVRHPLYAGALAYHVGAILALGDVLLAVLTVVLVLPLFAYRAAQEERVLLAAFGEDYWRYRERVPAFLPVPR